MNKYISLWVGMPLSDKSVSKFIVFSIFGVWLGLILLKVIEYNIWNQILFIIDFGFTVNDLVETRDVHLLRYILVLPALQLSDLLNYPVGYVFSIYMFFINVFIYVVIKKVCDDVKGYSADYLFILVALLAVNLFMNGRLLFSFLGSSLLFYAFYFLTKNAIKGWQYALLVILSLFLMSVSTGTFVVGVFALVFFNLTNYAINAIKYKHFYDPSLLIMILIVLIVLPFVIQYAEKNLAYFDWDLYSMMRHGYGRIFHYDIAVDILLILNSLIICVGVFICIAMYRKSYLLAAMPVILSSLLFGLFGYSVLFSTLPVLIAVFYLLIVRKAPGLGFL